MKESKIFLDYIDKIKKVIDKIKKIEFIFEKIKMEELNGGGNKKNNKLEKYKQEILKLREIRNKYLMELEMYKEKIKALTVQNQYFYKKISELSFVNYINYTEKNNLVDKLDFFNKSLDTLQSSILTNVNAGNELLERFNAKTKMNGENKISNVNITITNKDLDGEGFNKIVSVGGKDNNDLEINNNVQNQSGGYEIGKFKRENKISKVTSELQNKITLMRTITIGVRKIIENIIRNINDQNNNNSLLNIRIKLEWIINKFRELSEDNEEARALLDALTNVSSGLNSTVTDMNVFETLLDKINKDTKNFVEDAGEITKDLPINPILDSRASYNTIQTGGYDNEIEIDNLIKLINIYQRGGADNDRQYYDFNTITKWLDFFANCRSWPEPLKYKFNIIRTNYYMSKKVLEQIKKSFVFDDEKTNPLNLLMPIIEKNSFDFTIISNENISEVFKDDFDSNNSSKGIDEMTKEIKKELPIDLDGLMLAFLLENNSDNAESDKLEKYEKYFINMNNNLTELLYSLNFFKALSFAFKLVDPKETGVEIDDIEQNETTKIFTSLQKLTYQTELFKDPAEFITLKSELLQNAFTKLYWKPFEKFLSIYSSLDEKLQADIDILEENIKNFILGMKYSSNQSQIHSMFYNIDLNNKKSSSLNITDYDSTFLYINMLKRALYLKENKMFYTLFNAIINANSKNLELKIKKTDIINFSKLSDENIPELVEDNKKLTGGSRKLIGSARKLIGGARKLIGGGEPELILTAEEAKTKLIEDAKLAFNNVNRSKVTDMYSMIDKVVDGLKLETFSKIKTYIQNLDVQIVTKDKSGAFKDKTLQPQSITDNIDNTIKGTKELDIEKEKLRLILENIPKDQGRKIIVAYKDAINIKIASVEQEISKLESNFETQKNDVNLLKEQITALNNKIISSGDLATINSLTAQKKLLAKQYKQQFKTFYSSSKNKIKFINDKGYLLNFIEFVNSQEKIYDETKVSNSNSQEIIKTLGKLDTSNNEKFNNSKSQIKEELRELIKTSDNDTDYLEKYELLKKLNIQLIYSVDKIVTESLNAVTVFVKARKEGNSESDRYSYDKTCITVKEKEGIQKFGKFKNIFWSNRTISDLYCGKDINCNEKVPLTNSVRDMIQIGTKSVVIFTYGPSGSGKTKILTGIPYGNVEGDKRGVITRIMEDSLDEITISSSGTEISIEVMVGEIYGEKTNLSLLDNKYIECLYIWDLTTLEERLYSSDISQEAPAEYKQFTDKIQFLEDLKSSQYTSDDRKFNISLLDKIKIWRSTHQMKNNFNPDPEYLKKFLNLEGYTKNPTELEKYNNIYKIAGLSNDDESTLYTKFTDEDSFKKFSKKISDPKDISKFGQEVSMELEDKIDKIQAIRRVKNRVRCTKYNPDSSRSHMYIIIRIIDPVTGQYKYYIIIDKAGSEIPYEIAASEFVRLAPDLNEEEVSFFTITYPIKIEERPTQDEKQDLIKLKNKLSQKKLTEIQKIVKGDFINKTSIIYNDNTNPIIELFFSENFKIKIETKINDVSKRIREDIIRSGNTLESIKIQELSLSLNIKIIISGVSQDFNYVMTHEINKPLNIDLSLLMKILREQKKTDESIIREIIANIKSSKIKKNMPLLLFSGNTESNTNIFQVATDNINTSVSNLTNNLMDMLNLLNKGTSLPASKFKADFEKFYKDVEPQFLNYNISNLTTLPNIPKVSIKITKGDKQPDFNVINDINTQNLNDFKTNLDKNFNNINSFLEKLKSINTVNSEKIQLLIDSIKELVSPSAAGINLEILEGLTPENYDNILDAIQKGIEIIKKAYLFINLEKKIEAHKLEDKSMLTTNFGNQSTDNDKKNFKFKYESDFIKSLFEQVIEKSFTSSVDRTLPTTKQLDIDHRSLVASYFIQRAYFSKLKQGLIGCNSQVIVDVTTKITDTIRFIFDSVDNPITKSFINIDYATNVDTAQFTISEEMDKNILFEKDEKIKRDIGKWMNKAITNGTKPETLAELSKILDELKINYKHLNLIDEIKLIKNNDDKITFYIKKLTKDNSMDEQIKTSVRNLIKQLYLISKLDDVLRFLNFIENTSKKIIYLKSNTSIIANFDEILWKDNDKITYMIEYERLFNITSLFALDEDSIKFKELNQAKDQWTNNDRKDYGKIWENVANNIIPIYLLNVRQGFWINHSIRTLMRNIMYTSDNVWLDNPIFDVNNTTKDDSLNKLDAAKKSTAVLLLENIYTLEDYLKRYKNDKEEISNRIFSNKDTLEQVYLAAYDISISPWLKLLATIYHLGADNHPTDINIKLVKGAKSSSNNVKWGGTKLIENFVTLNLPLFKSKPLAEEFIKMIAADPEYPEAFNFSDNMFKEITSNKNPGYYLKNENDIINLRLPWNSLKLTDGEIEKFKGFFTTKDFENLFKYTIGNEEVTFEEIDKLNKIYEENNKLLIPNPLDDQGKPVKVTTFVDKKIKDYKEKVSNFTKDIAAMKIQDAMKQFNFDLIQRGGGFKNQVGGDGYTDEEKGLLTRLLEESKTIFPNKTDQQIIDEIKSPVDSKITDKQLIMTGRKDKEEAPFTKIIANFVTPILSNLDDTEKINYLFQKLDEGIIKSTDVNKYYAILNAWTKLSGAISALTNAIGHFNGDVKQVYDRTTRTFQPTTLNGDTEICEKIIKIKETLKTSTKFNPTYINNFININNLMKSIELICNFFNSLLGGYSTEIKAYSQGKQMEADITFVLSIQKKILNEINSPDINNKIFELYIINYNQELEKIKSKIITVNSKDIKISNNDNDRNKIITEIDKLIDNNKKLELYSNKSGDNNEKNNEKIILKNCEYILLKLKFNQDYLKKITASITINQADPIKTFNSINDYILIINEINEQNLKFRDELNNLIPDLGQSNQEIINEQLASLPDNFTAIDAEYKKYKEENDKLNTQNADLVKNLNTEFAKEIKVKGQLDISYPVRNQYDVEYRAALEQIVKLWRNQNQDKKNFILTFKGIENGENPITLIDLIKIPDTNKEKIFTTVLDKIINKIQEYINEYGIYPDISDLANFNTLVNSIYDDIKSDIFYTIKLTSKNLIKKIEFEKSDILKEIIKLRELIDYKPGVVLSDEIKKYIGLEATDNNDDAIKEKIDTKKRGFYNRYFKNPGAFGARFNTNANLEKANTAEINQLDNLMVMLSNLLFIEDFGYIIDEYGNRINEKYYTIDVRQPKANKEVVSGLITEILKNNKYIRENKIEDPLAGKNLDNVTIPELKASKQIQSINSIVKKFNISKSVILLLALSTSEYKVGLCTVALKFASLLTQITNPPCSDEEVQGGGGNSRKKYKLLKIKDKIIDI